MGLMTYNSKTSANVIPKKDFTQLVMETFNTVTEVLKQSLGPLGSVSLILDGQYTSTTKDGFAIFKNLKFTNLYKSMIYNLIKAPCTKLNNTVGDGTTSAIVLTNYMFGWYMAHISDVDILFRLPRDFIRTWDEVIDTLEDKIRGYARPISRDKDIYDIAYVTSNGNEEIATNVDSIYAELDSPVIKLKMSPTNRCYTEAILGFDFPANLIGDWYVKNEDMTTTETDMRALVFDCRVDADIFEKIIVPINDVFMSRCHKLLVIAPGYDELLLGTTFLTHAKKEYTRNNGALNLYAAHYLYGKLEPFQVEDLCAVLGCTVLNVDRVKTLLTIMGTKSQGEVYDWLDCDLTTLDPMDERRAVGSIPKAQLSIYNGSMFSDFDLKNNTFYQLQLSRAKSELPKLLGNIEADKKNFSMEISKANARVAQLMMQSYIYYVGANSTLERNVIYDSVEDVVKAVRSATRFGVVPGCQLSIVRACNELLKTMDIKDYRRLILELIRTSTANLYQAILCGPDGNGVDRMLPYLDENIYDTSNHITVTNELLRISFEINSVFDVEKLDFNPDIITSVETDIYILRASSDLVKLLISGNQCLYLDTFLNSAEEVQL